MKRYLFCFALSLIAASAMADDVMTKKGDTIIVNTTTLCDAKGYKGATPLKVYFVKKKIVKVESLPNVETKKFYARVKQELIPNMVGLKVDKAKQLLAPKNTDANTGASPSSNAQQGGGRTALDGVTGATFSSNAVKSNVLAAINYYLKRK